MGTPRPAVPPAGQACQGAPQPRPALPPAGQTCRGHPALQSLLRGRPVGDTPTPPCSPSCGADLTGTPRPAVPPAWQTCRGHPALKSLLRGRPAGSLLILPVSETRNSKQTEPERTQQGHHTCASGSSALQVLGMHSCTSFSHRSFEVSTIIIPIPQVRELILRV